MTQHTFLVEYSLDGGSSWTQKAANQSVAKNASATLTQSVSHDAAIQWRYKSSTASGFFLRELCHKLVT
jgi:hypothetical protein